MSHPFRKRRFWTVVALLVAAEVLGLCLARRCAPAGELYGRYADVPGVNASFIKDYRIDDTLRVDVTLLEATTDSAWALLREDFSLGTPPQEVLEMLGEDFFEERLTPEGDLLAIAWGQRTLCLFDLTSPRQLGAIHRHQMKKNLNNSSNIN